MENYDIIRKFKSKYPSQKDFIVQTNHILLYKKIIYKLSGRWEKVVHNNSEYLIN